MTKEEVAVIQAAMTFAEYRCGLDLGMPLQQQVNKAETSLLTACADLAAESDGNYNWFPPDEEGA